MVGILLGFLISCQPLQASNNEDAVTNESAKASIVGAWEIVETSVSSKDTSFLYSTFRSIILYTDKFYSVEIAHEDRPSWPDTPDSEKVSYDNLSNAYSNLTSNSGRYEVRGDSIFYDLIVAKHPYFMNDIQKGSYHFTVDGDKLTTIESWPGGITYTITYKRLLE